MVLVCMGKVKSIPNCNMDSESKSRRLRLGKRLSAIASRSSILCSSGGRLQSLKLESSIFNTRKPLSNREREED